MRKQSNGAYLHVCVESLNIGHGQSPKRSLNVSQNKVVHMQHCLLMVSQGTEIIVLVQ